MKLSDNIKDILINADIIIQLALLSDENLSILKEKQIVIGVLNPYQNQSKINKISVKNINFFL